MRFAWLKAVLVGLIPAVSVWFVFMVVEEGFVGGDGFVAPVLSAVGYLWWISSGGERYFRAPRTSFAYATLRMSIGAGVAIFVAVTASKKLGPMQIELKIQDVIIGGATLLAVLVVDAFVLLTTRSCRRSA